MTRVVEHKINRRNLLHLRTTAMMTATTIMVTRTRISTVGVDYNFVDGGICKNHYANCVNDDAMAILMVTLMVLGFAHAA